MMLRVLLVEADESTRQIIAALLRKCSYRVAAVSDGLKAWEVLTGNPHDIDLILMEVELPSISGYALLTLIMEHEICRNIPVIMMSALDSVGTVYKCMLRGAADFLVKPLRKNELKNLWQHFWRRQASASGGRDPQNGSLAQKKVEATAENNTTSNHSSGYITSIERNKECIEKGSDDQSSCTMPGLEVEGTSTEHVQDILQPNWGKFPSSDMKMNRNEECMGSSRNLLMHDSAERGMVLDFCKDANAIIRGEQVNMITEACAKNQTLSKSSNEAIDFIGAFGNYPKCSDNNDMDKVDSSLMLDLSLRRSHPNDSANQVDERRPALNHSDASAFSRYISRAFQPLHMSANVNNEQKKFETSSERQLSDHSLNYNSDTNCLLPSSEKNMLTLATGQSGQAKADFSGPHQLVFPVPVSVRDIRFEGLRTVFGSAMNPIFSTQSSPSPLQSSVSASHIETSFRFNVFPPSSLETKSSGQFDNLISQNANVSITESELKQDNSVSSDDQRHFSSATDQTASSNISRTVSCINSISSASNGNFNSDTLNLPTSCERTTHTLVPNQSGQSKAAFPCPQQTVTDVRFEGQATGYGSVVRPIFCTQSSPSPLQSPGSAHHGETSFQFNSFHPSSLDNRSTEQFDNFISQNANVSTNESEHKQGKNTETEDQLHLSSTTNQSARNSVCHGTTSHINSIDSGSNGNVNQIQAVMDTSESAKEDVFPIDGRKCHRSLQREAALTKFRLKRKDRCFEKKVRYESRKKLAEQRPRVKGQFVRRSQPSTAPPETND